MSKSHITTNVKGDVRIFRTRVLLETETDGEIQCLCILMVLFEVLSVDMDLKDEQESLAQWTEQCVSKGTLENIIDSYLMGKIVVLLLNLHL